MVLLALLLALALRQSATFLGYIPNDDWFHRYWRHGLGRWGLDALPNGLAYPLAVTPPVVVVAVLAAWGGGGLALLVQFAVYVAVLSYCLGPNRLFDGLEEYLGAWESGEWQRAYEKAHSAWRLRWVSEPRQMHEALLERLLGLANARLFTVIFWFALLGPAGALLYRLTRVTAYTQSPREDGSAASLAAEVAEILEWLPARLLGLTLALVGDLGAGWPACKATFKDARQPAEEVVGTCGRSALHLESPAQAGSRLREQARADVGAVERAVSRSLWVWVLVIAALTLLG